MGIFGNDCMQYTQFLIFEICRECNFGLRHPKCPNSNPARCKHCDCSAPMTDDQIIATAKEAYGLGFRGLIGWHYYNEPLMDADRMFALMERIKREIPAARFVLWTNGRLTPKNPEALEKFRAFELAWVTKYDALDYSRIKKVIPKAIFCQWALDNRISDPLARPRMDGCGRVFTEIIFDFFGNAHLCCLDWRGESRLGNLHAIPFKEILEKIQVIRQAVGVNPMTSAAPEACTRCVGRHAQVARLVPDIARDAEKYRVELWRQGLALRAIEGSDYAVIVAYRIPASRVEEHFRYNSALYAAHNIRQLLIVEKPYPAEIVGTTRQIVYPGKMERFNLPLCKNFGIRIAAESGGRVIIAEDIDVVFEESTLQECLSVLPGHAIVPVYRMIQTLENHGKEVLAPAATGVVSQLVDDWRAAHYNEKSYGYGGDDTLLLSTIRHTGRKIIRAKGNLWHLAHIPGTPQKEFDSKNPRIDHWGRKDGFHPEAFKENNVLLRSSHLIDKNPKWGLPESFSDFVFVFTHYKIPAQRLREWIAWNREIVEKIGARVIVVSDLSGYSFVIPDWMRVARFPRELKVFNLSACCNYGIRLAGRGVIAKIDPDIFLGEKFMETLRLVTPIHGVCPQYRMAASASHADLDAAKIWEASKGAMILHWEHWAAIDGYDERMEGYGIEDGDCFHRAGHAPGRSCDRNCEPVWHIDHGADGHGRGIPPERRVDFWGRKSGINPIHQRENQSVRKCPWEYPEWGKGLPICPLPASAP